MVFNFIKKTVLSKSGSMVLGLIAVCLLIWYAGRYVGIHKTSDRLILITVVLLFVLSYMLIKWLVTRSRAAKFNKDLAAQGGADSGRASDIAALKTKMDDAINSLRTSDLGIKHRGVAALYALPWYMIIGPSAAGKSTLLRNSGLHFPHSKQDDDVDIKGYGGTRNCDWWFSDEAVILDTAGRYTTEDNDNEEWVEFLSLIKRHRRKMPINGIIVAISIADLLTADNAAMDWHVKVVRDRINELITHLGFVFPLYIVFTKCDLLNGFQSFFGDLNEGSRGQVWGSSLDLKPGDSPGDVIIRKFEELYARLCEWRIRKIHNQRKIQIKSQIYDFPAQFQAAAVRLLEFVNLLFKDNPYQETPNFKGVYFTSGTQEGLPLQRVVGNLRQAFGYIDKKDGVVKSKQSKSYFIKALLKDVIFKSPLDMLMSRRKQIFNRWFKSGVIVGCFAMVVGTVVAYSTSFTNNTLLLGDGVEVVESLDNIQANERATNADSFIALSDVLGQYDSLVELQGDKPWYYEMGIYHGEEQIKPLQLTIIKTMETDFLVPVAHLLERKLLDYSKRWATLNDDDAELARLHADYYQTLKVYMMLTDPRYMNAEEAMPLLVDSWKLIITSNMRSPSQELQAAIDEDVETLVQMYLTNMSLPSSDKYAAAHWSVNSNYVRTARSHLRTPPNAEFLYTQIIRKSKSQLKPVSLQMTLKSRGSRYLTTKHELPGVYTKDGWENYASREIKNAAYLASNGDWVLGTEQIPAVGDRVATETNKGANTNINVTLAKDLEQQMRQRYFADYSRAWYDFIGSIRVSTDRSINDTAEKLNLFSRIDGPIAELFQLIDVNINLDEVVWRADESGSGTYKKYVIKGTNVKELERTFTDLRRFTTPAEKMQVSELVNQYLISLTALQGEFDQLRNTSEQGREAEIIAATIMSGKGNATAVYQAWQTTLAVVNGSESRTKRAIEHIFQAPVRNSWRVILSSAVSEIQSRWASLVVSNYDERLRGRFPFSSNGPDAALDDVAEFFHPEDGVLWAFVNVHLQPYLYKHNGKWRERQWMGLRIGFNPGFITALNRGQKITDGLFKRGTGIPQMVFYIQPAESTTGLSNIVLESNGQTYNYRHEPEEWRKFTWPGPSDTTGARVQATSDVNNFSVEFSEHGTWGMFHLMRKARLVKQRGTQYLAVWDMETSNGRTIEVGFHIKPDRHNNLFQPGLFTKFTIPKRIIGGKQPAQRADAGSKG